MKTSISPPTAFTVIIPARLASSRLPNKPLADIGGVPMVVRVAQQAQKSKAERIVVAVDDVRILEAVQAHGFEAVMTHPHHPSGSDRLAEVCTLLKLPDNAVVVNVQGDEPLIDPALIDAVAGHLGANPTLPCATAAHPLHGTAAEQDQQNPNIVKVVLNRFHEALYFSRAPLPYWRDGFASTNEQGQGFSYPLRHIGIYAYHAGFLRQFPALASAPIEQIEMLEQLRILWHGHKIGVFVTHNAPEGGVDTPEDLQRVRQAFIAG
jgi:3-deoxy-manno-octulosonate cytidylyltransferase (CMP-KDO synthetase)